MKKALATVNHTGRINFTSIACLDLFMCKWLYSRHSITEQIWNFIS